MGKRTKVDFSKHEVKVTKTEGVLIHEFKIPYTIYSRLVFINTCGVMTVTGDFGNWVFCREFHPSTNTERISDGYWDEKLQISSFQKSYKYDSEATLEAIQEFKKTFEEVYGCEMSEMVKDWIEQLEDNVDDETEYKYLAYREMPSEIDYDSVPYGIKRHYWLEAVYDGFEALCEALKHQEQTSN